MNDLPINHEEALQLAHMRRGESNLARCYIAQAAEIERLTALTSPDCDVMDQHRARVENLRWALANLKTAVDREGWPAGWGQIRALVEAALPPHQGKGGAK